MKTTAVLFVLASMLAVNVSVFAAKGDPNGKGLPVWPAIKKDADKAMVLGDKIKVGPAPDKVRLDFFELYYSSLQPR